MKNFPKNFFWGASTSAHQVEGGSNNNWSRWEKENAERLAKEAGEKWDSWQQEKFPQMFEKENYISGLSADHYHKFAEDFDLAQSGGHNAHRFSIDWARIEPEKGKFDQKEIAHYQEVVKALREKDLEPFVTLWHWTNPLWLEDKGGVLAEEFSERFTLYAEKMAEALGEVKFFMTLNEPMSIISSQYVTGAWPHSQRGLAAVLKAYKNLSQAHCLAYDKIKAQKSDLQVGFTEILTSYEPSWRFCLFSQLLVKLARYWSNRRFIKMTNQKYDFLGVQYYFHKKIGILGARKLNVEQSDLGWDLYAEGLYNVIKEYACYGVPLYVTEDGLADAEDSRRKQYLTTHIAQVEKALAEGVDLRGYFHWSLLDNFEWDKGYWPRFGLIEVDFETLERKPRRSFWHYKKIIEKYTNGESGS